MPLLLPQDYKVYQERRNQLVQTINKQYVNQSGVIILFGAFEQDCYTFKQEPSFYYFTGIEEPAAVCVIDIDEGTSTLLVPNFGKERAKWIANIIEPNQEQAEKYLFNDIEYLGQPCRGYQCHPFFNASEYEILLKQIQHWIANGRSIFTLNPQTTFGYIEQRFILQRIISLLPDVAKQLIDISSIIAQMRRKKSKKEIELMFKAIEITVDGHYAAARVIEPDTIEFEVQAAIEYVFTASGGSTAFPSIVASGKNSTVLHYNANNKVLENDDLVVIDIGAAFNYYCADLTRTYPVSGTFSKRQREIYNLVLDTQEYIASIAKPGMYIANKDQKDQSLHYLAQAFLQEKGYANYFTHGIGHFLGLDVHDVGNVQEPLQAGDVITIEPGIYIPEEELGVRIEDDYWIIEKGAICLSENLPRHPDDIKKMIQEVKE